MPRDRTKEIDVSNLRRKYRKRIRKVEKLVLSRTHPTVAAQWHPKKNKGLGPEDVTYGSHIKLWWLCDVHPSHEWEAAPHSRCGANGKLRSGCPCCSGNKACVTNSLATLFPKIASDWHPSKNTGLTPEHFTGSSNYSAWWQCKINKTHVWQAAIGWRTRDDTGCPFCSNKKVSKTNSLAALYPKLASEFHSSKNGNLTAREVIANSHTIYWWECRQHHEWQTSPKSRIADKTRCPYCVGRIADDENNLAVLYPDIASEWHPIANGKLSPWTVLPGGHRKIYWRCSKDQTHIWQAKLVSRTRNGSGCPECALVKRSNKRPRASKTNNLSKTFPQLAKQWHPTLNGDLRPTDVTAGSNKFVWWKCAKASDHVWSTQVASRVTSKTGCPFCSGRKVSTTNCLAKTFPEVAAQWHPTKNGALSPALVTNTSKLKVWWQCSASKKHAWQATVRYRTQRGQTCPKC